MNKCFKMIIAIAGLVFTMAVFAAQDSDEGQNAKYDEIASACEAKYTEKQYPDEDDRYSKIDRCIEDGLNKAGDSEASGKG